MRRPGAWGELVPSASILRRGCPAVEESIHRIAGTGEALGIPTAMDVLERRAGDPLGRALLLVALARAVGLPSRVIAGLLYANGQFFHHAWVELYLDDWVPADPTYGQIPADAGRIRLQAGRIARQIDLILLLGQLRIDVLEVTDAP